MYLFIELSSVKFSRYIVPASDTIAEAWPGVVSPQPPAFLH